MNDTATDLGARLLAELRHSPGLKAAELAATLAVDRHAVTHCLTSELATQVQQGADYRWRLIEAQSKQAHSRAARNDSEIARLCRYYLECIGQDMDDGASVLASARDGEPNYAELPALPLIVPDTDWLNAAGVARVLGKVRQDRAKLVAWLGYPVRLRRHRTERWEGFFIEPLLLWRVELSEEGEEPPTIDDVPLPNAKFLRSVAMGDSFQLAEEMARLTGDLGLNVPLTELPQVDELIERLERIRPDWDWQEVLDPTRCAGDLPLWKLDREGIYNRAIVLPGERSIFTQGLENELKALMDVPAAQLATTALGQWLNGIVEGAAGEHAEPLLEVLPMNTEQRAAVRKALSAPLTVVTGPPGTGKSQVVTNLLVNAAWCGMSVLFASKNNKAVDVVEARVNGLGRRPVLLRQGAKENQAKLATHLTQILAVSANADDQASYNEALARHRELASRLADLERTQQQSLDARNNADRVDAEAEDARALFGDLYHGIDEAAVNRAEQDLSRLRQAIDAADPARQGMLMRLLWGIHGKRRMRNLEHALSACTTSAASFGVALPANAAELSLGACNEAVSQWQARLAKAKQLISFREALALLKRSPSFEDIARQRAALTDELAENSRQLWRSWVQLVPTRLTAEERKDIADYVAVLQVMTGGDANRVHRSVREKAQRLQSKVAKLFTCWAVTSLSARGRVPFEPAQFDLVVIDEASQCDIASALPLLYRAKRCVIIGDPQQLRHISALTRPRDSELQYKHGLIDTRLGWMYSVSSLYDAAASVVPLAGIINLRDHHRSHSDIIEFSNRSFYEGRLRVATRYPQLKRPSTKEPGILWQDVPGGVIRPSAGGAQNAAEAKAVIAALEDLLVTRGFEGTVGVVTPFRAQAQLLQKLAAANAALEPVRERCALLIDTVHSFQGDERDVMLFSPVVSERMPTGALGFLRNNGNLFNVAITRARGLLQVVGDRSSAASCGVDYLADFANYVLDLQSPRDTEQGDSNETAGPEYPQVPRPEQVSDWERLLYRALYSAGVRPIPQYRVEQYDLDFAVFAGHRCLNIEVDGERYHRSWTGELCLRDQLRNQRLIELGWDIKRFWVYEVRDELNECVAAVKAWVEKAANDD